MKKKYLYLIFFLFSLSQSIAQVRILGLNEDSQPEISSHSSTLRTASFASFSDTLTLPFFDDFSSPDIKLDSIVLSTTTNVKIFSHYLEGLKDTTLIVITGVKNSSNSLVKKLNGNWYIIRVDTGQFYLDSSKSLTNRFAISKDSVIKSAYYRLPGKNNFTTPHISRWQVGSGAYINNRFPKDPPSYNVATFDGLASNRLPYNTTNINSNGLTDNLTSLPIRLKNYTPADSIYLSFYWQTCGYGEVPDPGDSIYVELLDSTGVWNYAWGKQGDGSTPTDAFYMVMIKVINPIYFHKGFKFRFQAFGRQSGIFDVWNIDYVYLNKGRNAGDVHTYDWSIGSASTSFLKNFTSMPYGQFFADSTNQIDSLKYTMLNHDNSSVAIYDGQCTLIDNISLGIISSNTTPAILDPSVVQVDYEFRPTFPSYSNNGQPRMVIQNYYVGQPDKDSTFFGENNTFNTNTILWDYYAYDDGSPEGSVASNLYGSMFANQYSVIQSDTLNNIDIYFTRTTGPNMTGRTVFLTVWDENFNIVSQQPISVGAPNIFTRYYLITPYVVGAGKVFYIGYQQKFNDLLSVGYDRNNDRSSKVYINDTGGANWDIYSNRAGAIPGAMMIRAVFSKGQILLNTKQKENKELSCELYPNPTEDIVNIVGNVSQVIVYDLLGKEILQKKFDVFDSEKSIHLYGSPQGMYLVYLSDGLSTLVKKIIIR